MHPIVSKPIIELESKVDFVRTRSITIQHYNNGFNRKLKVPISDGSTFEGVLYTIREFSAACNTLNLTKGQSLFNNFRLCLVGNAREEWDIISNNKERTNTSFQQCIREFKRAYMTEQSKANLLEYLQFVTKPKTMDVHTFVQQVQMLNRCIDEMPDNESLPSLTESQLKHIILHAMPSKWQ